MNAKRTFALTLLALISVAAIASFAANPAPPAARTGAKNPVDDLARLYRDGRYFELRDAVARMDDDPSPALDFYRGAVDISFNRLEPAIAHLRGYLGIASGNSAAPLARAARLLLADAYCRAGQYRSSAETVRIILDRYGATLKAQEKKTLANQMVLWSALAGVPPQTVEVLGNSVIRMNNRRVPVAVMGRTVFLGYDTGSSFSILVRSAADELGLTPVGPDVLVQSATGRMVEARAAVASEIRLGETVIRNAVFLVFPDDFFPPRRFGDEDGRHGLLGAPVLSALREFTETADGRLLIPASPRPRTVQNMCFSGFTPIVEVIHRQVALPFVLDTGSAQTFLHPPFFRRYRGEIKGRSKGRASVLAGVGDTKLVQARVLDELDTTVGGMGLAFKRVLVHEQVTNSFTRLFFGTLGRDVLMQCERMTLNFDSMSFVLE